MFPSKLLIAMALVIAIVPVAQAKQTCATSSTTAPHATDDVLELQAWPTATITIPVLQNDYDPDGGVLHVVSVTSAAPAGSTAIAADGRSVLFTPNAGYSVASFQYGVSDGTATASASVLIRATGPQVSFAYACSAENCSFAATPSTFLNFVDYTWTFTRGTSSEVVAHWRGQTYFKTFSATGAWTVTLQANYLTGYVAQTTREITLDNILPYMDFVEYQYATTSPNDLCIAVLITETNYVNSLSADYSILWDDTTGEQLQPSTGGPVVGMHTQEHCYSTPGIKRVRSVVQKHSTGEIGTRDKYFEVHNGPPEPSFTITQDPANVKRISLSHNWFEDSNSVLRWEYDFGDGGSVGGSPEVRTAGYTYPRPGTYQVRLKVTDGFGVAGIATREVTIANEPPKGVVDFTCKGLICSFDASASQDDVEVRSYAWSFEGGGQDAATGPLAEHTFGSPGKYPISVTLGDGELSTIARRVVEVRPTMEPRRLAYYALPPCRAYDTISQGPLSSGVQTTISLAPCVPADAVTVELNATIVGATQSGDLRLWSPNETPPPTSILNFPAGVNRANNAAVNVANAALKAMVAMGAPGTTRLILDVVGYYASPVRQSVPAGHAGPLYLSAYTGNMFYQSSINAPILSSSTSPVTLNLPAPGAFLHFRVGATDKDGSLALYAAGAPVPPTSMLNFQAAWDESVSNGAFVMATPAVFGDAGGQIRLKSTFASAPGTVGYIAYIKATLTPDVTSGAAYEPIAPCRLLDSRDPAYGYPKLVGFIRQQIRVRGNCGVPGNATGARLNVAAINPVTPIGGFGYLLVEGMTIPWRTGVNTANGVIVWKDPLGYFIIEGESNVIVDVVGYYYQDPSKLGSPGGIDPTAAGSSGSTH